MITFSNDELMAFLSQDCPFLDNTTFGLGISGNGRARFYVKNHPIVLCGIDEAVNIAKNFSLTIRESAPNASKLEVGQNALVLEGDITILLKIAKSLQNLIEYASSVATYTHALKTIAAESNPNIAILGTRKNVPFAKKLQLKGLISGGGIPHRYGLSDSILVFSEHLDCVESVEAAFARLKSTFKEHKIIVEISTLSEARHFVALGADILQCEKMSPSDLKELVNAIKAQSPQILISATGGINLDNIAQYAKSGVDMIVTTSMYRAEIYDIKVEISRI